MAIDPICGMTVDESSGLKAERDGRTYYFCSDSCRRKFLGEPPAPRRIAKAYFCPMDDGVESDEPGICPVCGMALEPAVADPNVRNAELRDMSVRLLVGAVLGFPVFILGMGHL